MKLREEEIKIIENILDDTEAIHIEYDKILRRRLKELDPEFLSELDEKVENTNFWYS